jgi:glutamate-1-semialdehyde 2,1-aminomutase
VGDVFQAGTLSGNPLAMAAGCATLRALQTHIHTYRELHRLGARFTEGLRDIFTRRGIAHQAAHVGSMVGFFFTDRNVVDLASAKTADTALYADFFHTMLAHGIYLAPSQFEAGFLSTAHTDAAVDETLEAAKVAGDKLRKTSGIDTA